MSCGCRPVGEVRAEDRSEVTIYFGNGVKGARPDGGRVIDALFFGRITFSFFQATAVRCASDAATMVAYVGCCVDSRTGNDFLEYWRKQITDAGEIWGASREVQNLKRMRGCIFLILLSLDAPGMSSNNRGQRPGARRSEGARRHPRV